MFIKVRATPLTRDILRGATRPPRNFQTTFNGCDRHLGIEIGWTMN